MWVCETIFVCITCCWKSFWRDHEYTLKNRDHIKGTQTLIVMFYENKFCFTFETSTKNWWRRRGCFWSRRKKEGYFCLFRWVWRAKWSFRVAFIWEGVNRKVCFIWGIYNKLHQKAKTITDFSPVFNVNFSGLLIYFTI